MCELGLSGKRFHPKENSKKTNCLHHHHSAALVGFRDSSPRCLGVLQQYLLVEFVTMARVSSTSCGTLQDGKKADQQDSKTHQGKRMSSLLLPPYLPQHDTVPDLLQGSSAWAGCCRKGAQTCSAQIALGLLLETFPSRHWHLPPLPLPIPQWTSTSATVFHAPHPFLIN